MEDALASYTREAAYAEIQEERKGMLRAGMRADLVLLSTDLESLPPEEIPSAHVVMTVVEGRIVYEG
ncbi:MAG: amidohydrolase family protein [Anaerolineales bacterium]|nr:amidohydrolase family protein [Anaerolineales bacterium]